MSRVPAICDRCGTMFPSPFEVVDAHIQFSGIRAGPCPRCGGSGHIPDGLYHFVGDAITLLSGPDRTRDELSRLVHVLSKARERGDSAAEVAKAVERELPQLSGLGSLLPKSRSELYAFIGLILLVIQMLLGDIRREPGIEINVQQVFNQITYATPTPPPAPSTPEAKPHPKVGRNESCSCGSGLKYTKCCGAR